MGRPRQQPGQVETRKRILDAAEFAFADRGFDVATLEDIAQRAGIRRPSLLYHFETKQVLYTAVIENVFSNLRAVIVEALSTGEGFAAKLDAVVIRFEEYVDGRPQAAQLVLREIIDNRGSGRDILLQHAVPLLELIEDVVRSAPEADVGDVPIREALMAIASTRFVRASAGSLAEPMWGPSGHLRALAHRLFFSDR